MFTVDILAIHLLKQLFNKIYLWPNNAFYGAGAYTKLIISLFIFQQAFNLIYSYKAKKGGESK